MRLRCLCILFTAATHVPPKCDARGGFVTHSVPWTVKCLRSCLPSAVSLLRRAWIRRKSFLAPMKLLPLSVMIFLGAPLLDVKRLRVIMQSSLVRLPNELLLWLRKWIQRYGFWESLIACERRNFYRSKCFVFGLGGFLQLTFFW